MVGYPPNGGYKGCLVMWWYVIVHLPNGKFWLVSCSQSVISSITGPKEKIFGHAGVAPSSVDRMAWCARKTAAIHF